MTENKSKIKILIADDHPLFRQGLKHAFAETPDIDVVSETNHSNEILNLVRDNDLNLVLLDIAMPGKGGLEVLKQLKTEFPKIPVLILSVYPENQYAVRFIRAGASGYLTKESPVDTLLEAVRKVAHGGKFASPDITEKLAFDFMDSDKPPHELLSDREYQVFSMIAAGKTLTEIGQDLSLSVKTISTHRTRILDKMKMKKNAELIHYAIQHELL
ncbi:MAG: response regulator [Nitrospinaceae bacterium]|nr:response regulator transcription factor [Nitrospinaceae bacterium]NIR54012.1 response regulator transcription factor [Nitrospinaceae bacterium]NIS84431.1 response regulator transcription factor [Nitrospinaceae bacterium]NIT81222.1 response regulator transcription factor [Nitrospinaceae bacterium]NIU43511.1 response regulator transcription factor [Nitrospinaceae bacterium]